MRLVSRVVFAAVFALWTLIPSAGHGAEGTKKAPPAPKAPSKAGWEENWEKLLEAAKKEGKVVVSGTPAGTVRKDLPEAFEKRFGISMDYQAVRTAQSFAKLKTERAAGLTTVDVFLGGPQPLGTQMVEEGVLDPLKPKLILPEATNPKNWFEQKLHWTDREEQYVLSTFNYVSGELAINKDLVDMSKIPSWKEFLKPDWKGRIAVSDPTVAGSGQNQAVYLWTVFGEEFLRKLYVDQAPAFSRDQRQLAEWVARGTHWIALGVLPGDVDHFMKEGLPIVKAPPPPDAPGYLTGGSGHIGLVNKAPHPNAAMVFVNWIAGKEGNEVYSRAIAQASGRRDVSNSWISLEAVPREGVRYTNTDTPEFTFDKNPKGVEVITRLLRR